MEAAAVLSLLVFLMVSQAVWLAAPVEASAAAERVATYVIPIWEPRPDEGIASITRRHRDSRFPWLERLLDRINVAAGLSVALIKAGVPLRPGEFVFLQLVCGLVFAGLALLVLTPALGGTVAPSLGVILGFFLPLVWLRYKRAKRLEAFDQALPDGLDLIAGALRAGFGLAHGLDLVVRSQNGPCAEEFGQVLQEVNLGADLDVSLARINERVESEDARLLATAVAVQRRTGGNLIEVLAQLAGVIRERQRLKRDVRVITTAPRVSGYVVALLPLLTLLVMFLTSEYYVQALFTSPVGRSAAAVGGVLVLIGLFLNHRIAQVDY